MAASLLTMANAMLSASDDDDYRISTSSFERSTMNHNSHQATPITNESGPPRRKKSVDFTLFHQQHQHDEDASSLPQHKRMRLQASPSKWTPKQVVDALATCVTRSERLEAIQRAVETFESNDDESHHNQEMAAGADAALLKHFVFLLRVASQTETTRVSSGTNKHEAIITTELALTAQAMELVHRSSSSMVRASFLRMGSITLSLLIDAVEREMDRRLANCQDGKEYVGYVHHGANDNNQHNEYDASHDASLFLQYATKLLGHYARVGDAIKTLANFPKCLPILMRLCQSPYSAVPWQARLSALWVIANLACDAENMLMMVTRDGLVETLVNVARRPLHKSDSALHNLEHFTEILRSRNIVSRAILNLSWAPENKIMLAENAELLDLMAELSVHRQAPLPSSHTISDILVSTRRHAVGALRNLAAAPKRIKLHLCAYRQGLVLDVLTDAALNDPDAHVKERAFAAIHNMAVQDTAETIINHPALVLALRGILLNPKFSSEEEAAMKRHANATIMVLERTITPSMSVYASLQDLLQAVNPAPVDSEGEDDHDSGHSSSVGGDDDMRVVQLMSV
ncbi:hypothetical protein MPSEU_000783200 [Mayamaea pseudoterrestris]|nr:hypothetical protein MPSEU_000783200 [Mayamaea pseudoterrestris]